jgi:hypothetical protein
MFRAARGTATRVYNALKYSKGASISATTSS